MTVSYSRHVATSKVGTFARLLFRWKGSIYKLIYRELIIFITLYCMVSAIYRYFLSSEQRKQFEQFALFCERTLGMIPITFILGFYVSLVVGRWWNIFMHISYPDRLLLQVSCWLQGSDERARMSRRTIARYANLSQLLVLRDISSAVRKRFPSMQHLIDAGFMSDEELKLYESIEMTHHKFWMPLQWICSLLYANRKENRIESDQFVVRMMNEVLTLRSTIMTLLNYDWISVPLVYSQVVTIAVYSYFTTSIFAHQYLDPGKKYPGHEVDMYFPLFTILQFIFYLGWLKVAESIMNPLGEDDDDFEVNYLLERNLRVSYAMADDNYMKIPPLKRDLYWNEPEATVPHTLESAGLKDNPHIPSAITEIKHEQLDKSDKQSILSLAPTILSIDSHPPNGFLRSFSKNGVRTNLRRVISNVSHSMHLSDTNELDNLLEEQNLVPLATKEEDLISIQTAIPEIHTIQGHIADDRHRSISVQSNHSKTPKLFTVHEGTEKDGQSITSRESLERQLTDKSQNTDTKTISNMVEYTKPNNYELCDLIERIS